MNVKRVDILATGKSLRWNVMVSGFILKTTVEAVVVAVEAEEEEVTTGTRTI